MQRSRRGVRHARPCAPSGAPADDVTPVIGLRFPPAWRSFLGFKILRQGGQLIVRELPDKSGRQSLKGRKGEQ